MQRSIPEEEREIKETIRRALRTPDKKGAFRRDTLNRMIALIHSPHSSIKIVAAGSIQLFLNDFPDLEEAAINAVYDLCEDQSSRVRMEGYATIIQVSRAGDKWIKRNADVLVQLLQNDEPDEVVVVKKALIEHMDMDPKVTLSVLCDQLLPADETASDEEHVIRDRLRSLVVSFLTGEAKRSILRHATAGSDTETILVEGLIGAVSRLSLGEIHTIINDLLLSLEGYDAQSHGTSLLNAIIQRASDNLRRDLQSKVMSLDTTRSLLELANDLLKGEHIVTPINLLRFYCSYLTGRLTLHQLSPDARLWIVCNMAQLYQASSNNVIQENKHDLIALRKQIAEACPLLLQVLWDAGLNHGEVSSTGAVLLRLCLERKNESGGVLPTNLLKALETMLSKIQDISPARRSEELVELTRSLYSSLPKGTLAPDNHMKGTSPAENLNPVQYPLGTKQLGSLHYNTSPEPSQDLSSARFQNINQSALLSRGAAAPGKHSLKPEGTTRPLKRRKEDQMAQTSPTTSSLLSRLSSSIASSATSNNDYTDRDLPAAELPQEGPPPGGWSIKGAATASLRSPGKGPRAARQETGYSLLDRLDDSNIPSSARGVMDMGDRRKKKGKLM